MTRLEAPHREVVQRIARTLAEEPLVWALTGSTSFALQDVPLDPDDIDVQTTEEGAYTIEEYFSDNIIEPVRFSEGDQIRSHFGVLELCAVRVELMGAVQKRRQDGTWEPPVDITNHRKFVSLNGMQIPVLSLRYEAQAYERLGRTERAELLREYAE